MSNVFACCLWLQGDTAQGPQQVAAASLGEQGEKKIENATENWHGR